MPPHIKNDYPNVVIEKWDAELELIGKSAEGGKMKINLTDQELNEWVAKEVMGWKIIKIHENGWHEWAEMSWKEEGDLTKGYVDPHFGCDSSEYFNPSGNLNHTHLMEEKIRDRAIANDQEVNDWERYVMKLKRICDKLGYCGEIHASARQRVEAAYLTFKESK